MQVIQHLKTFPDLETGLADLKEQLGIVSKVYDNFVLLNYDQIESPKLHPLVIECRSLILAKEDYRVLSRAYDRFFNLGEALEYYHDFSWEHSTCFEKADGSLIKIWFNPYDNRWEISTRGSAQGESPHALGGTFRDWVLKALGVSETEFQRIMENDVPTSARKVTFILEYVGPENRIVTRYAESHLVLTGVRYNDTGVFLEQIGMAEICSWLNYKLNIRLAETYDLSETTIAAAAAKLPSMTEGYVVYDSKSGKRIKVKNPSYVVIHNMRGNGITAKAISIMVGTGNHEEYLSYFPEEEDFFEPYLKAQDQLLNEMTKSYEQFKNLESQKDFALAVKDFPYSGIMFTARKAGVSPFNVWVGMDENKRAEMIMAQVERNSK